MAGKSTTSKKAHSTKTGSGKQKVEWQGYVNFEMTADQAKAAKKWLAENPNFKSMALQEVIENGYSLKVSWSEHSSSVSAGLYCQNPDLSNQGYCLTQHSADGDLAITKVLYVHFQLLRGAWNANGDHTDVDAGWY